MREINTMAKGHNYNPTLTCEGECSEGGVSWTQHKMLSETYDKDKDEFVQLYSCISCKTPRRFGACVARQTLMGERN